MPIGAWHGFPSRRRPFAVALGLVVIAALAVPAEAQDKQPVDLELALLVDVSASVSDPEYRLQAAGLAAAFRSPAVIEAIRASARQGLAVSVIQWSNAPNQKISIEWSLVRDEADALGLSARLESAPRLIHGGHTALGSAITFAKQHLDLNRFEGLRRVIDLSGDGRTNDGRPLRAAREEAIADGITINGLAILNELPLLDDYFRDHLIGGEGAFYIVAQDYGDFAQAMTEKLVREIGATPLSENRPPEPVQRAQVRRSPGAS